MINLFGLKRAKQLAINSLVPGCVRGTVGGTNATALAVLPDQLTKRLKPQIHRSREGGAGRTPKQTSNEWHVEEMDRTRMNKVFVVRDVYDKHKPKKTWHARFWGCSAAHSTGCFYHPCSRCSLVAFLSLGASVLQIPKGPKTEGRSCFGLWGVYLL